MKIVPFAQSCAIVNSRGQIVAQSPDPKKAIGHYLEDKNTKATDPIRIVVSSVPSETRTKI